MGLFVLMSGKRPLRLSPALAGPATLIFAASMLSACARQPIVDYMQPGFDQVAYQQDLSQCQMLADQVNVQGETAQSTAIGGLIGAGLGALTGSFNANAGRGALIGGSFGAASGLVSGGSSASERRNRVVRNCLAGRGYRVLD